MGKGKLKVILQQQTEDIAKRQTKNKKIVKDNCPQKMNHQSSLLKKDSISDSNKKLKHLAICFPDSILQIPQTSYLRSYFIGEIARFCAIFKVDEIIILKDHTYTPKSQQFNPSQYIVRNLQYLETPQYLRKHLFKIHPDLKNAGVMNPIQCHHHLKMTEVSQFREGVTLERPTKPGCGSWVDIGLKQQARMDRLLPPLTRVTLRLKNSENQLASYFEGQAVSKRTPRIEKGLYWGYDVSLANNLKNVIFSKFDLKVLCSHSAEIAQELLQVKSFDELQLSNKSMLILFTGVQNLVQLIRKDVNSKISLQQALQQFECKILFEGHGVKQLRIQEQIFIALSRLAKYIC